MPKWLRITVGLTITAVIFLAVLGFIFYNMLTAPLPEYNAVLSSNRISAGIQIYRDSMAVPYIIAENENDASFALGYVHAQERLFSMDLIRRAGDGRLSEILGSRMVPFDKMFLTVGIRKFAHDNFNRLDPRVRSLLESYSAGVNLYIRQNKGKYPLEFDVLGYEPYEWRPEHCLTIIRLLGWEINIAWWVDYTYTTLISKIGEEKAREIIPDYNYATPHSIPVALKGLTLDPGFLEADRMFRKISGFRGTQIGSNNWVVNDSASSGGKPIIANDPHLAYSAPNRWFAAVIRGGNWNAEGATLPGVPGVVIGKNRDISWVLTNVMADETDFYIEQLDSSGTNYMLDGKWVKLTTRKVKIPVKDSVEVEHVIKYTHRGPIISGLHPYNIFYKEEAKKQPVVSMRWSGSDFSDEMLAFYNINLAKNWDEFRNALRTFGLPGQNFVYADRMGNIGYVMGARIPLRPGNNPLLVYDGTLSSSDWKGYLPYERQPALLNPPSGFFATANNKVVKDFDHYVTNLWEPESRVQRIYELLRSKQRHSVKDFMNYQMDQVSPYARELTKYLIAAFEGFEFSDDNLKTSLDLVKKWDYSFSEMSQTPSVYAVFLDRLLKNIYLDDLGKDMYNEFVFIGNIPYRSLMDVLADTSAKIIDDVKTDVVEHRDDIIRKSFADAVNDLEKNYGPDITNWQWGTLHKVEFSHPFGGFAGIVDHIVNIGPFRVGGDGTTIFNTEYPFNESIDEFPLFKHDRFENDLGPTFRYIYDFADPDVFYFVLTTGQSGHVLNDHYKDMSKLWLKGKYMKIRTDLESIRRNRDIIRINKQ